jgi:hypothetical protein
LWQQPRPATTPVGELGARPARNVDRVGEMRCGDRRHRHTGKRPEGVGTSCYRRVEHKSIRGLDADFSLGEGGTRAARPWLIRGDPRATVLPTARVVPPGKEPSALPVVL